MYARKRHAVIPPPDPCRHPKAPREHKTAFSACDGLIQRTDEVRYCTTVLAAGSLQVLQMVYKLGYRVLHSSANGVTSGDHDASIKPRSFVFVHGLCTSGVTFEELAQQAINNYASATGQPWQAVLVDLPG